MSAGCEGMIEERKETCREVEGMEEMEKKTDKSQRKGTLSASG
jgi:hypothetical protein